MNTPPGRTPDDFVIQERRSERVARLLSERIASYELPVGAKLPSEHALAARFGVSRAVVREAIAALRAEGLVETIQGSGAFVRARREPASAEDALDRLTRASVGSLLDLIKVRCVIEGEIAALAALNRSESDVQAITDALQRIRIAQANGSVGMSEDRAFHSSIASACGNPYWRTVNEALGKSIEIAIEVTRSNEARRHDFSKAVDAEHAALRNAIAARDPDAARAAAVAHMEGAAGRVRDADEDFWVTGGAKVNRLAKVD